MGFQDEFDRLKRDVKDSPQYQDNYSKWKALSKPVRFYLGAAIIGGLILVLAAVFS